jgi:hypothetical protein
VIGLALFPDAGSPYGGSPNGRLTAKQLCRLPIKAALT